MWMLEAEQKSNEKKGHVFTLKDLTLPDEQYYAALQYAQHSVQTKDAQAAYSKKRLSEAVLAAKFGACSLLKALHDEFKGVCLRG